MKKIISIITLALLIVACTDRFEKVNRNPFELTDESIKQNFNYGAIFTSLYRSLIPSGANYQYSIDWQADNFVSHTGTPLDEYGGRDMMSYYFVDRWNSYMWDQFYNNQMSPARLNIQRAEELKLPLFKAMAELIQVMAMANITTYYGPVIYSEYGEDKQQFNYDSEEVLYDLLFAKLDDIRKVFVNATEEEARFFARFDPQYGAQSPTNATTTANGFGSVQRWVKFINSFQMRLAMRLSKAKPTLAKSKFEEAVKHPGGIILAPAENFWFRFTGTHTLWTMAASWNDCRMGSAFEEVLVGFEDPRISRFWRNVHTQGNPTSAPLSAKFNAQFTGYKWAKPDFQFKGIAPGARLDSDKLRDCFSSAGTFHNELVGGFRKRPILLASEVNFLLAEAKLRGWDVPQSIQYYYEEGVRQSFNEWEVPNATTALATYLAQEEGKIVKIDGVDQWVSLMPIDYYDPADRHVATTPAPAHPWVAPHDTVWQSNGGNSYKTKMTDPKVYTVKWRDDVSKEQQLERIMTQKWIATFQNSIVTWDDLRRTGYPKLPTASMNNSNSQWGIVPMGEGPKRAAFVERERKSNVAGVEEATKKLGGPNLISTPLWIHTPWPDFKNPDNKLP